MRRRAHQAFSFISKTFVFLVLFSALVPFALAGDRMTVEANILASVTSISVPDYIFFGNVTPGYSSDKIRIDINNTGTTAVTVTPQLTDSQEKMFSYLYFARRTTDQFRRIGSFNLNISQPNGMGRIESEYFYAKLDLSGYTGSLTKDMMNHKATVVFWALPQ